MLQPRVRHKALYAVQCTVYGITVYDIYGGGGDYGYTIGLV